MGPCPDPFGLARGVLQVGCHPPRGTRNPPSAPAGPPAVSPRSDRMPSRLGPREKMARASPGVAARTAQAEQRRQTLSIVPWQATGYHRWTRIRRSLAEPEERIA